nr:putative late blight resistance protein homolog R1A-10 [Ipomoea batatas]
MASPRRLNRISHQAVKQTDYLNKKLIKIKTYVHRNLETMYWLKVECCTKDLFTMIPNLKKLGIDGRRNSKDPGCFNAFVDLGQLEKLSIRHFHNLSLSCSGTTWATNFLPNLKKLNFFETMVPWSDIELIGMLPNLEVLKLIKACQGLEWEPSEGGFCRLKRLVIGYTNLKHWNATGDHFPVLECLEIESCNLLQEIPSGFADITTLALIHLNDCWDSLLASAKWIRDEQHNYGNVAFLVRSRNIKPKSLHKFNEGWDEY